MIDHCSEGLSIPQKPFGSGVSDLHHEVEFSRARAINKQKPREISCKLAKPRALRFHVLGRNFCHEFDLFFFFSDGTDVCAKADFQKSNTLCSPCGHFPF